MSTTEDVRRRAVELLDSGLIGDSALRSSASVHDPLPVFDPSAAPEAQPRSWFVPVAIGEKLAGFAERRPDLELIRYASFQRLEGDTAGPPDLAAWTDPATIRARAATLTTPDETIGEPVLSYDRSPSRLVWAASAVAPDGQGRTIYVAGDYVYEGDPS